MRNDTKPGAVEPRALGPLAAGLRTGSIDLFEYLEYSLARVDRYDGAVRALLPEPGRRARLLAEASILQERFPEPGSRPPLYGVLLGVKDIFAASGFETRAGSRLPPELFRMPEGPVVAALRRAGALVLGKTVTTEFAYFAPGPTGNPWDLSRTPGGSSSGSAAAVAAGFCPLALGTQTIGSISRPAAYCGIAGWKPSYERTSRGGVFPFSESVDHVGLLAPDSAGLALAASIIAGSWNQGAYDSAARRFAERKPILAVPEGPFLAQADKVGLDAFESGLSALDAAGFSILRVEAMADIDEVNARHRRIAAAEMERVHRGWLKDYGALYAEMSTEFIAKGAAVDDAQLEVDLAGRASLRSALEMALDEAGADFWISPPAQGPAPVGLNSTGSPIMNLPWTHAGLPTLAVPSPVAVNGMPTGLQLAAPFGQDEALLALGAILERSTAER